MRKKIGRILLLLVLYLTAGALLPFLFQPKTSDEFQAQFRVEDFYSKGEKSVDRAGIIETNMEALNVRLAMIEEAKERIVLSTFDIRPGGSCTDIFSALCAAADRGVKVQVFVDGLYGAIHMKRDPMFYAAGSYPNVEIRFYNTPNPLLPWTVNGRMHDKYLIIDDQWLLLGGRNTFDYFLGEYTDKNVSYDREVLIHNTASGTAEAQNSVIGSVLEYFDGIWNRKESKTVYDRTAGKPENGDQAGRKPESGDQAAGKWKSAEQAAAGLREHYREMKNTRSDIFGARLDEVYHTVPVDKVTFISNPTHRYAKEPLVWYQLTELMKQADHRIYIQTPYAAFSRDMYRDFAEIGKKQVQFTMQVNSIAVGDNFMASSDYKRNRRRLQETGVQLYEFQGANSSHGKSGLIDEEFAFVGSYNLDMRSTYVDTETVLVIQGEEFNQMLEECIIVMHDQSLKVLEDGSYEPQNGVEAVELTAEKKLIFAITSRLFQLIRFLI